MLNLKSTILIGLLPISLCIGLGVLLYSMHFGSVIIDTNSLASEQEKALNTLKILFCICHLSNTVPFEDINTLTTCYTECLRILNDPVVIQHLQSLEGFYPSIPSNIREYLICSFEAAGYHLADDTAIFRDKMWGVGDELIEIIITIDDIRRV